MVTAHACSHNFESVGRQIFEAGVPDQPGQQSDTHVSTKDKKKLARCGNMSQCSELWLHHCTPDFLYIYVCGGGVCVCVCIAYLMQMFHWFFYNVNNEPDKSLKLYASVLHKLRGNIVNSKNHGLFSTCKSLWNLIQSHSVKHFAVNWLSSLSSETSVSFVSFMLVFI